MPINITMPALSPTMEEGNLAKWLVKEGDKVSPGDVIAEIETDKATMEVEAVDEGTLAKITVPAGTEGVKVNAVIAVLTGEDEDAGSATVAEAPTDEKPTAGGVSPSPQTPRGEASPERQETVAASGYGGSAELATENDSAAGKGNGAGRVLASPLARRIAGEAGVDLATVNGTGPHGRIVKADVEAAAQAGQPPAIASSGETAPQAASASPTPPKPAAAPAPQTAPPSDDAVLKLFPEGSFELVPHDTMRKTIARRLVEAKQTVPHFYLTVDCDLDALLALRAQVNAAAPVKKTDKGEVPAYKVSVNDMVIKALALSLRDVPDANVSWTQSAMVRHKHVDVGVAVSIPGGLITPIIRKAEEKTLSAIANEMKDLAARARGRKLKPEEFQGGTTAVSNLGMFGVKSFSAVINPPHATILAVGAGEQRAVVRDGAITVATVMSVTLSTDHRAVDGALGAELMQAFRTYIEKPMGMLV